MIVNNIVMKVTLTSTILEMFYIIYFLNFFRTRYSIAHPLTYFDSYYLKHPIGRCSVKQSMICPFGHEASYILASYILLRYFLLKNDLVDKNVMKNINTFIFWGTLFVSFLNFNAVIYLLPIFIYEFSYNR